MRAMFAPAAVSVPTKSEDKEDNGANAQYNPKRVAHQPLHVSPFPFVASYSPTLLALGFARSPIDTRVARFPLVPA